MLLIASINKIVSQSHPRAKNLLGERVPQEEAGESFSEEWMCPCEACFQMSAVQHFKIVAGSPDNIDIHLLDIFPPTRSLNFASVFAGKLDHPLSASIVNLRQNHSWKGESHRHETVACGLSHSGWLLGIPEKLVSVREALQTS